MSTNPLAAKLNKNFLESQKAAEVDLTLFQAMTSL